MVNILPAGPHGPTDRMSPTRAAVHRDQNRRVSMKPRSGSRCADGERPSLGPRSSLVGPGVLSASARCRPGIYGTAVSLIVLPRPVLGADLELTLTGHAALNAGPHVGWLSLLSASPQPMPRRPEGEPR